MKFKDRIEAANLLAEKLATYKNKNAIILAIPRGGVPMGNVVANQLKLPLEVVLSKKIGHPLHKEFAIGAVTLGSRFLVILPLKSLTVILRKKPKKSEPYFPNVIKIIMAKKHRLN